MLNFKKRNLSTRVIKWKKITLPKIDVNFVGSTQLWIIHVNVKKYLIVVKYVGRKTGDTMSGHAKLNLKKKINSLNSNLPKNRKEVWWAYKILGTLVLWTQRFNVCNILNDCHSISLISTTFLKLMKTILLVQRENSLKLMLLGFNQFIQLKMMLLSLQD